MLNENEKNEPTGRKIYKLEDEELYDSNGNPLDLPEDYYEDEGFEQKDKIFGNSYNTGDLDFKSLPDIKAHSNYSASHLGHVYNSEEYNTRLRLEKLCGEVFEKSQWTSLPRDKNFPKDLMPYVFNELFTALDKDGESVIDIVLTIAEFMGGSYDKIYWAMGFRVKERLVAECNFKFGSLNKNKKNRLF